MLFDIYQAFIAIIQLFFDPHLNGSMNFVAVGMWLALGLLIFSKTDSENE